jgi:hypothetical protein
MLSHPCLKIQDLLSQVYHEFGGARLPGNSRIICRFREGFLNSPTTLLITLAFSQEVPKNIFPLPRWPVHSRFHKVRGVGDGRKAGERVERLSTRYSYISSKGWGMEDGRCVSMGSGARAVDDVMEVISMKCKIRLGNKINRRGEPPTHSH